LTGDMTAQLEGKLQSKLFRQMFLIRRVEERLLELFAEGKLFGTTHTSIGQEANAAAVISQLHDQDIIFSSHRCHGHYLARFGDPVGFLAEVMGRTGGICGGRGGSQHLCRENFYSNGIQGGYLPVAAGMAFAQKVKKTNGIVTALIGDGTMGEGTVYESLNMAALREVPLLIVVENNRYAQTTPIDWNLAGTLIGRAEAFGISCGEIESNDIHELHPRFTGIIDKVRGEKKPHVEIVHTYRLRAHSKGDDFRPAEEIAAWAKKDPLIYAVNGLPGKTKKKIEEEISALVASAEKKVAAMPFANLTGKKTARAAEECVS